MGEDLRMGLDPRDCRLDAAMILGDESIPDNITWKLRDRDKTCVWLDFIDSQFNPIDNTAADVANNTTVTTNVEFERVSAQRKMSTNAETEKSFNDETTVNEISTRVTDSKVCTVSTTTAQSTNRVITVNVPRKNTRVVSTENKTITIGEN
jgi:hypothetical protein